MQSAIIPVLYRVMNAMKNPAFGYALSILFWHLLFPLLLLCVWIGPGWNSDIMHIAGFVRHKANIPHFKRACLHSTTLDPFWSH